jgi:preprotein translocase subunit SecA
MSHADVPVPGLLWGVYPQRRAASPRWRERLDQHARFAAAALQQLAPQWQARQDRAWVQAVRSAMQACPPAEQADVMVQAARSRLQREGLSSDAVAQALACVCVLAERELRVMPFDTQLIAAKVVLNSGLAEMATGEGKTLAVALAAAVAALAGMPVHVVTSNDYLVARDAQQLAPLYGALGLRVGHVVQADAAPARALAYGCDITYVTANELVFDYLRDGLNGHPARTHTRTHTHTHAQIGCACTRRHGHANSAAWPVHGHRG